MAMLSVQVKQMPTVLLAISIGKLIEMPTEKNKQTTVTLIRLHSSVMVLDRLYKLFVMNIIYQPANIPAVKLTQK